MTITNRVAVSFVLLAATALLLAWGPAPTVVGCETYVRVGPLNLPAASVYAWAPVSVLDMSRMTSSPSASVVCK